MWGLLQFTRTAGGPGSLLSRRFRENPRATWRSRFIMRNAISGRHITAGPRISRNWRLKTGAFRTAVEAPVVEPTSDGYVCSVAYADGADRHVWRIRQDRLLKLDEAMPVETEAFIAAAEASTATSAGAPHIFWWTTCRPTTGRG